MRGVEARPSIDHPASKEAEPMNPDYGAFIQVLQKRGNSISYVSYPLPRGITDGMVDEMVTGILYPEPHFKGDVQLTRLSDANLPLMHRPGVHIDAVDRLVSVPRTVLEEQHPEQDSHSMKKYDSNYRKIVDQLPGVKDRFVKSLHEDPKAKVADGGQIFHGAYKFTDGNVIGLNLEGTQLFNLVDLPNDEGHQDQMNELVDIFRNNEDVTVVLVDKTKTVADCAASCSRFFEMKEANGEATLENLTSYQKNVITPQLHGGEKSTCSKCKHALTECSC